MLKKPGAKALILDSLLADVHLTLWKKNKPDFSNLFLNSEHIYNIIICLIQKLIKEILKILNGIVRKSQNFNRITLNLI
jgi:hypothetical protein